MHLTSLRNAAMLAAVSIVGLANASPNGAVSTDRFGYTGVVTRYGSLDDAKNGSNAVENYNIGNRDLSLYIVNDFPGSTNYNIIMGSWWYTTDPSGSAGWGNVRGNSGRGFVQLYDDGSTTVDSFSGKFGGYNGTYYTTYTLDLSGSNAGTSQYSRFWVDFQGGGADKVLYHNYSLNLTATGLEGTKTGNLIEANNHPVGVTGTYSGIFENISSTYPQNNGFYTFTLNLDMDNWSYANRDSLTGDPFAKSYFGEAVPGPAAVLPFALGLLAARRRRRK